MKLRNKRTGEIHEITQAVFLSDDMNKKFAIYSQSEGHNYAYRTLAELNKEWEDYEEQKEIYFVDSQGDIQIWRDESCDDWSKEKSIGNYFETEEEAEKAVEKLKAWKRLKDKGFRFKGLATTNLDMDCIEFDIDDIEGMSFRDSETHKDLDLLFGGEK